MRVLLADDQSEVRSALRLLLEQEGWLMVVGEAAAATSLLDAAAATQPDIVLLDWELPGLDTVAPLCALWSRCPGLGVVAMSGQPEAQGAALAAGAAAFVSKGDPPELLLGALSAFRPPA